MNNVLMQWLMTVFLEYASVALVNYYGKSNVNKLIGYKMPFGSNAYVTLKAPPCLPPSLIVHKHADYIWLVQNLVEPWWVNAYVKLTCQWVDALLNS